jgi:C4-dicarboxylate-specific signal transduction histidine kinase
VLAILRDISDRRRRESQQQLHQAEMAHVARLSMLGEIASGLAHELNQPLSAILSYAQGCMLRLRGPGLPASETVEAIEQIAVQAERAGEILRRIRGFVRRRTPSRSTLQLNEQIENVLALAGHGIREHAVEVIKELDPALPPTLGDRIQLDQVLLNLMWNAVEALSAKPDGRRRLWLRTTRVAEHGVQVTVRDNGPGFASGSETRLFEPFFTTKPQGMGMGLAISRSIIESHGGQLWATANPDGGAAFHFYLPAATRDEPS